jgi:hypothetical protein
MLDNRSFALPVLLVDACFFMCSLGSTNHLILGSVGRSIGVRAEHIRHVVLEGRSELRPNCELPHHEGLRVLTFPRVDSKLSLAIMLRAQTLTFDAQAPVSMKVPHERTLIVIKAIFWAEQPAEIRGVGTLHVVKSLTFFIAEGKPFFVNITHFNEVQRVFLF